MSPAQPPVWTFLEFAGKIFRYQHGDHAGRGAAMDYSRAMGVPEYQLDWPD